MTMMQIDELYNRILKDQALAARLVLDKGEGEFETSFVELGKVNGYSFTREELTRWTRYMKGTSEKSPFA